MALIGKREDLIHVPWSSVEEWLQVYKQIYSGDLAEQNKAYEILLVWKARIPQLPVGVECTLGLIQVCLRDREWTPKINTGEMSISYENDLRMMYSTVIMKFLNHISNIAHNKQTSLFVVAKQLNIPDWIVDMRHNIAHGHELPSIDVMRVVGNILLTWLHEEYWVAEAKNLQESQEMEDSDYLASEDEDKLTDLIELWTAIGLYIKTNHVLVSDLPDTEIRETLSNTFSELNVSNSDSSNGKPSISDRTELATVLNVVLSEISRNLNKGDSFSRREKIVIDSMLSNEAFLTSPEILSIFIDENSPESHKNCLPQSLVNFWKDFLLLLQEKKILLTLFLRLIELIKREKDTNRKLLASLWVKTIAQAYSKQKVSRHVYQSLEQKFDHDKQPLTAKAFAQTVQNEVHKCYPELRNVLGLNVNLDFPDCLTDANFVKRLIMNSDEYSEHFIPEILKISSFLDCDTAAKDKLLELMKIQSLSDNDDDDEGAMEVDSTEREDKIYTVQDFKEMKKRELKRIEQSRAKLADYKIRNTSWIIASGDHDWSTCPIGLLPWQVDDAPKEPLTTVPACEVRFAIVKNLELPKIVDSSKLKQHSKIQWENLMLKNKKKRPKKRTKTSEPTTTTTVTTSRTTATATATTTTTVMDKAVLSVKSMRELSQAAS